jgi:hypothetical protein
VPRSKPDRCLSRRWMVDPVLDGRLGLGAATVAEMVGHDGGGPLIATVYSKLGQHRMHAGGYDDLLGRQAAATVEAPRLHVVA